MFVTFTKDRVGLSSLDIGQNEIKLNETESDLKIVLRLKIVDFLVIFSFNKTENRI